MWLHATIRPRTLLEQFKWEISEYHPYSPDFAPSNYLLFLHLKKFLASHSEEDNRHVGLAEMHGVNIFQWMHT